MRLSPLTFLCAAIATLGLAGCSEVGGDVGGDPARQIGANPYLPEPREYLLPPMHIAPAIGWSKGETPSVPQGMAKAKCCTGRVPRSPACRGRTLWRNAASMRSA